MFKRRFERLSHFGKGAQPFEVVTFKLLIQFFRTGWIKHPIFPAHAKISCSSSKRRFYFARNHSTSDTFWQKLMQ
jgi:hypothetical protein